MFLLLILLLSTRGTYAPPLWQGSSAPGNGEGVAKFSPVQTFTPFTHRVQRPPRWRTDSCLQLLAPASPSSAGRMRFDAGHSRLFKGAAWELVDRKGPGPPLALDRPDPEHTLDRYEGNFHETRREGYGKQIYKVCQGGEGKAQTRGARGGRTKRLCRVHARAAGPLVNGVPLCRVPTERSKGGIGVAPAVRLSMDQSEGPWGGGWGH